MNDTMREIMKSAPNPVLWICGTVLGVTIIGAFVVFGITGSDPTEFRAFLNTLVNIATLLLSGGALVTAGAAAKSAGKAEEQTNGALDTRMQKAVHQALEVKERENGRPTL